MSGTNFANDAGTGVVTADGFVGPITGDVTGSVTGSVDATGPIGTASYTVVQANALTGVSAGDIIYVSNGDAGAPCLAVRVGSDWLRIALGAAVAAS